MKRILSFIWRGWKAFAHVLGIVNTHILLTVSYFVVLGIASISGRVFGADLLDRRMRKKPSYWRRREPAETSLESCRRQF